MYIPRSIFSFFLFKSERACFVFLSDNLNGWCNQLKLIFFWDCATSGLFFWGARSAKARASKVRHVTESKQENEADEILNRLVNLRLDYNGGPYMFDGKSLGRFIWIHCCDWTAAKVL